MKEMKKFVSFFAACYILIFALVLPPSALAQAPQHFITVGWTFNQGTNTDIAIGFDVYRSTTSGGPYAEINTTVIPISATTFNDNGPGVAGTKYFYVIDSVDQNGVHSGYSPETSATWVNSTPPNPTGPTATAH